MGNCRLMLWQLLQWLIGKRQLIGVEGDSMEPTFKNGDVLIMASKKKILKGDVVVFNHPFIADMILVKRVKWMDDNDQIYVVGDNPESTDSRSFGTITKAAVIGKIVGQCDNRLMLKHVKSV